MLRRYLLYGLAALLVLLVIIRILFPRAAEPGRYQVVRINDHTAILVDTATGETWRSFHPDNIVGPEGWRGVEWKAKER